MSVLALLTATLLVVIMIVLVTTVLLGMVSVSLTIAHMHAATV